jgi:hypothetical protein
MNPSATVTGTGRPVISYSWQPPQGANTGPKVDQRRKKRERITPLHAGCAVALESRHAHREPAGPHVHPLHAVAAAVVRDANEDDQLAILRAAAAIAKGNERAASRFGYCMASAIVDELRNILD